MAKIEGTNYQTGIDHSWIKESHDQIEAHSAWNGNLPEKNAEKILQGKGPFTYILRGGEQKYTYFISYVKDDLSVKHQKFVLELDRKGWHYRNGVTKGLAEILEKDLEELIPQMMHCDHRACIPLTGQG